MLKRKGDQFYGRDDYPLITLGHRTITVRQCARDSTVILQTLATLHTSCYSVHIEPPLNIVTAFNERLNYSDSTYAVKRDVLIFKPKSRILLVRDGHTITINDYQSTRFRNLISRCLKPLGIKILWRTGQYQFTGIGNNIIKYKVNIYKQVVTGE